MYAWGVLQLFPKPDSLPLHELNGCLLVHTIFETRDAGELGQRVHLPWLSSLHEIRHTASDEVSETKTRQRIELRHRSQDPQVGKALDVPHQRRLSGEF